MKDKISSLYSLTIYPEDAGEGFVVEFRSRNDKSDFKAIAKINDSQLTSIEFKGRVKSDEMNKTIKIVEKLIPELTKAYYVLKNMYEYINQE